MAANREIAPKIKKLEYVSQSKRANIKQGIKAAPNLPTPEQYPKPKVLTKVGYISVDRGYNIE